MPPFSSSMRANHVLLNNYSTSQTSIGWHNLLKGRISKEWSKLWTRAMVLQNAKACEQAYIKALWNHIYRLWIFRNKEDHKNDNRAVAEYKQRVLDDKLRDHYVKFALGELPLNPQQPHHFDIKLDQLLLLSYDIRNARLISADLYISRAAAFADPARGSEAHYILQNIAGRPPPPDANTRQ
jgi:hypothetical protein